MGEGRRHPLLSNMEKFSFDKIEEFLFLEFEIYSIDELKVLLFAKFITFILVYSRPVIQGYLK